MCTLTWFVKNGGYELFFNRDERVQRRHAQPPTVQKADGVEYISPTDADAGGTWIAANHFGVTVCLLNHYQFEQIETYKDWTSRGEIVRQFSTAHSPQLAAKKFLSLELVDFRAFRMFIIDRTGANCLCVWDGHSARVEPNVVNPKSSSSVDAQQVKSRRRKLFTDLTLAETRNTQKYLDYHASHLPSKSKESVCMHRADANTVSLSYVSVDANGVAFAYADGAPCIAPLGSPLCIKVRAVPQFSDETVVAWR